jgi:hypothetical protein
MRQFKLLIDGKLAAAARLGVINLATEVAIHNAQSRFHHGKTSR